MVIRFAKTRNPAAFVDMRLQDRQMVIRFAKARNPATFVDMRLKDKQNNGDPFCKSQKFCYVSRHETWRKTTHGDTFCKSQKFCYVCRHET